MARPDSQLSNPSSHSGMASAAVSDMSGEEEDDSDTDSDDSDTDSDDSSDSSEDDSETCSSSDEEEPEQTQPPEPKQIENTQELILTSQKCRLKDDQELASEYIFLRMPLNMTPLLNHIFESFVEIIFPNRGNNLC